MIVDGDEEADPAFKAPACVPQPAALGAADAELVFVLEHWPEFSREILERAIEDYRGRDRRFGGCLLRSSEPSPDGFLLEPPPRVLPPQLETLIFRLMTARYQPILTHPERLS